MSRDPLLEALVDVVGEAHVLTSPDLVAPYVTDWTGRFAGTARAVVRPADTAQVAAVLAACHDAGAAVVAQGGNTGLVGGSVPAGDPSGAQGHRGEVVVSMTRLDQLGEVDDLAAQVSAGAGVTIADLHAHAGAAGFTYGVDFAARDSATVGGTIATNAGGIRVVRHGATRAQVVGIEAVLADGRVLSRMGGLLKDNTGYDLPGLLTGSEGTLALVTGARLRLVPELPHRVAALLAVDDTAAALAVLARLRGRIGGLEAVEAFHHDGVELVARHTGTPAPFATAHPSYLLVEVADHRDPTDELATLLGDAPEVRDVAVAADRPSRAALWAVRESHTEAINALGAPHKLDVSVAIGELVAFETALRQRLAQVAPDATVVTFGHLGDGNIHVNVVGPPPDDETVDEAVLALVAEHGGSISAEHGIGRAKAAHLGLTRDAVERETMRAIKSALDPEGRLNPAVLLA